MNPAPAKGESLQGQVIDWLMRLESAPGDAELRAEFESWLSRSEMHRRAYAAVGPVWGASVALPPLTAARREAARGGRSWYRRPVSMMAGAALAACVALFAVPALQLRLAADHMTGTAERRDIVLEDGSRIALDAGSAVAVEYAEARRSVRLLSGQAFFEVTPSAQRPFVVSVGQVDVTVTGTAFDVARSETGVAVSVQSGSVNVTRSGAGEVAALAAGQWVHIAGDGQVGRGTVVPGDVAAWRDRRLVAYDAVLRDVVEQVGRRMPGMIVFADSRIANSLVSGIIDLDRPDDALRALVDLQQGRVTRISPYLTVISSR
ncbi:MAG: putative FecR protein [Rhodospirillaceae bacterium]|nr:MAG: putative FecR protein [Rhodospirillaceae bacterium]